MGDPYHVLTTAYFLYLGARRLEAHEFGSNHSAGKLT